MKQLDSFVLHILLLLIIVTTSLAKTGHHHSHHGHLHERSQLSSHNASSSNASANDALEIVNRALEVLKEVNRVRLENPLFNKHEFKQDLKNPELAPPLDYSNSSAVLRRRGGANSSVEDTTVYTIPAELREAARIVAESEPQVPSGNHSDVAVAMKEKYALKTNDTNKPTSLKTPEGRLADFGDDGDKAAKRANANWMVDMGPSGSSPLAPKGYKVWRNVRDYGAKGDGITDDTKAIQRAISEGGRCGPNCGSSTLYPAVVYFPFGTYLVSSPLIQYYNTEFLGDPHNTPTLLAAKSFVGQGVITSDVYITDDQQWYLNTANFLRSVRNFKIDLRLASPSTYLCGIHWQVAQATSLENIEFYMLYESDVPGNNQQGIYMENGSGGFLADLTFVGGHFGAYFGNQQFTTSHLIFVNAVIAVQVHWDWAWTMQDFVIESCGSGLVVVGGAGGPKSTGQGVGSLVLVDSIIANTPKGIVTTLVNENSTSLLVQNVGFFNTKAAITDESRSKPLVAGGNQVILKSWGFGLVNDATSKDGKTYFANGVDLPNPTRNAEVVGSAYPSQAPSFYTRRRPKYHNIPANKVMNVKALGAKGDGITDDTKVLNSILEGAANTSSVVFIPYGIYLVTDTIRVPIGSRIIGQVWSQIMGTGSNFEDESHPRPIVQVGKTGDVGIIEIQELMITVKGPTAGAIVIQWNARQSSKGSTGLWDTHIRVGGAKDTALSAQECPKKTGHIEKHCKAAAMLMHLTPGSSAYLENAWLWTADHDMDTQSLDQVNIYAARGLLIESDVAWLWGTSVEHNVLYQYQLSGAKNIVMGMIQTESPYFQPLPKAPSPFTDTLGSFTADPTFTDCISGSLKGCASSWAVRIIDSSAIYILGTGLYSWFDDYSQECLKTEDCQLRGFEIEQTKDIWIWNICTKAIKEMISPLGGTPTLAKDNMNGFLSSVLAWLQGSKETAGERKFEGYRVWTIEELDGIDSPTLPDICRSSLTEMIRCDNRTEDFQDARVRTWLGNNEDTDSVCDVLCDQSLKSWFDNVAVACSGYRLMDALPTLRGGRIWAGVNQTCLFDPNEQKYCGEIFDSFPEVPTIRDMDRDQLCSDCWLNKFDVMRTSEYSAYDQYLKDQFDYALKRCGYPDYESSILPSPIDIPNPVEFCASGQTYKAEFADTCDSIAKAKKISSAALYQLNPDKIPVCWEMQRNPELCLPSSCERIWVMEWGSNDTCASIEVNITETTGVFSLGAVRKYNRWVNSECSNLWSNVNAFGRVLCVSPPNGRFQINTNGSAPGDTTTPVGATGYSYTVIAPPKNVKVATGTTQICGGWHVAVEGDNCRDIAAKGPTTISIFMEVNPSVGKDIAKCSSALITGQAYCALPNIGWNEE